MEKKNYEQKVTSLSVAKLCEFNFKMLHNIMPCGNTLHKWQSNISEKCVKCGLIESVEHMLFECKEVKFIWKSVSCVLNVNVKWKNIVCGLLASEDNKNVLFINYVLSVVAYAIFKFKNKEKWNCKENQCTLDQFIVKNLMFYRLYFQMKSNFIFDDKRLENLIECLT